MELNELIALMAASLMGGIVARSAPRTGIDDMRPKYPAQAVKVARQIWEETLRQERED